MRRRRTCRCHRCWRQGAVGTDMPLTFTREGTGTLFYTTRLRYAADTLYQHGLDTGFNIERRYEPYVENGSKPIGDELQGGRSRARHVDVPADEGAPLRRRHRSAAGRIRSRSSRGSRRPRAISASQQDRQTNDGGDANNWQQLVAIQRLRSRRASRRSHPAVCDAARRGPPRVQLHRRARRPPERSAPRPRAPRRCTSRRCSAGRRRTSSR